jgi:predicted patatin/cPLA2 family phospholipase
MNKKDYSDEGRKHKKQRALVLQGGGALGAYEAGVIRDYVDKLSKKIRKIIKLVRGRYLILLLVPL